MKKLHGTFKSSSGLCDVHYYFYVPEHPRAAVIFSHGMCEYIERYDELAQYLCESDIAFCGCDHIGHGNSVESEEMLGYFGEEHGHLYIVRDLHRMKLIAERRLPDIPHFLIGHSMGSFAARTYLSRFNDRLSGAILMGTSGPVAAANALHAYLDLLVRRSDGKRRYDWGMGFAMGVPLLLIGLGCAPIYPSVIHATPANFGKENSQAIIGIQMASAYVGTTFMPPLFGVIAENINIGLYPFYMAVFAVLMVVCSEWLNKKVSERI